VKLVACHPSGAYIFGKFDQEHAWVGKQYSLITQSFPTLRLSSAPETNIFSSGNKIGVTDQSV